MSHQGSQKIPVALKRQVWEEMMCDLRVRCVCADVSVQAGRQGPQDLLGGGVPEKNNLGSSMSAHAHEEVGSHWREEA